MAYAIAVGTGSLHKPRCIYTMYNPVLLFHRITFITYPPHLQSLEPILLKMPAINSSAISVPADPSLAFSNTIPSPTLTPSFPNDNSTWSAPIVIGIILAILAVVVGIPSAVLAVKNLRLRRRVDLRPYTDDTAHHHSNDDSTSTSSDIEGHRGDVLSQIIIPPEPLYLRSDSNATSEHVDHESANDTFDRR